MEDFFNTLDEIRRFEYKSKKDLKKCSKKVESIKYFEPCLTIDKNSFYEKTQLFIKNLSGEKIAYNDILKQTRNFMRYIGF